jgi:putative phage-type endonuclease
MTITNEQLMNRKNHLGGSDIPAIMGFSRFASPYDIWLLKTGRVQQEDKKSNNITAGNLLEQPLIKFLETYLNKAVIVDPDTLEKAIEGTLIITHPDGLVVDGVPVEGKTEGVDHPYTESWGEVGTDEVPEYTCIQSTCHMMAYDTDICHVPTFLGGRGFGYFFVRRDERIAELIRRTAIEFWNENVLADKAPENSAPSLSMIKRIRQIEGEVGSVKKELVDEWIAAKERESEAKKQKEFYQAEILAALDGREAGEIYIPGGTDEEIDQIIENQIVTNFKQERKGYVVEPTSFRVLRLKKVK